MSIAVVPPRPAASRPHHAARTLASTASAVNKANHLKAFAIAAPDPATWDLAWERQQQLTKPSNALGVLETVGVRLAAIQRRLRPSLGAAAVIVCASDHGVVAERVSAYPAAVTAQMVENFLAAGAAINQLASVNDSQVYVLDVGVEAEWTAARLAHPHLWSAKVRSGPYATGNIAFEAAMTRHEAERAIEAGRAAAARAVAAGATLLAAGDMGIGNTTSASALTAALLGISAEAVTGRGTGIDDAALEQKIAVVNSALLRAGRRLGDLTEADPLDLLAELGGFELAAIAGVYIGGAEAGVPCVLDGFPVTVAAILALRLAPALRDYLFAGHCSLEPGHRHLLEYLDERPLLQLDLRLGEGSGAVLAFGLLRSAAAVLAGMATFGEAGVSRQTSDQAVNSEALNAEADQALLAKPA
jgi:nicotinate-nucleotide--dimethylbenzimidazole phosphoribosyltransferase